MNEKAMRFTDRSRRYRQTIAGTVEGKHGAEYPRTWEQPARVPVRVFVGRKALEVK